MFLVINDSGFKIPEGVMHEFEYGIEIGNGSLISRITHMILYTDIASEENINWINSLVDTLTSYCTEHRAIESIKLTNNIDDSLNLAVIERPDNHIIRYSHGYEKNDDTRSGLIYFILFDIN